MNLRDRINAEIESVCAEIDADDNQERATLEGWHSALLWVLKEMDKE